LSAVYRTPTYGITDELIILDGASNLETLPILPNRTANERDYNDGINNDRDDKSHTPDPEATAEPNKPTDLAGHGPWCEIEDGGYVNYDLRPIPLLEQVTPLGSQGQEDDGPQERQKQEAALEPIENKDSENGDIREQQGEKRRHQEETKEISSGIHQSEDAVDTHNTNDEDNEGPQPAKRQRKLKHPAAPVGEEQSNAIHHETREGLSALLLRAPLPALPALPLPHLNPLLLLNLNWPRR
jgi:hypothetical protein